jgi:hypothetical protein
MLEPLGQGSAGPLLPSALHTPVADNLFSIGQCCQDGYIAVFDKDSVRLVRPHQVHITGDPVIEGQCINNT